MPKALIVVDVQNDFCEGGSLAVAGGTEVASKIADYINEHELDYDLVIATRDWHPDTEDFVHFSKTPDFKDTWPVHCVAGTVGASYKLPLDASLFVHEIYKGQEAAAYSGFEGTEQYLEYTFTLEDILKDYKVDSVDVCGIATDFCVAATVRDAIQFGFKTNVLADLTAAVGNKEAALTEMLHLGATIDYEATNG